MRGGEEMLKKVYQELVAIRKELQAIRNNLESKTNHGDIVAEKISGVIQQKG